MKRFRIELPGYDIAEVQKVGNVVRIELNSEAMTLIVDFGREDARAIADALHGACHEDLWQTREPFVARATPEGS